MKKSILALAVAASTFVSVAQADGTTLYGSVRMHYRYDSNVNAPNVPAGAPSRSSSFIGDAGGPAVNASRFGIRGEEELGNGLTAFYQYENRIGGTLGTRKILGGLKGGFGSISIGRQDMPLFGMAVTDSYSDPFNVLTPGSSNEFTGTIVNSPNALVYWTPDMSGFQVGAGIVADGGTWSPRGMVGVGGTAPAGVNIPNAAGNSAHVDMWQIVAQYNNNGIYAGLGYEKDNRDAQSQIDLGLGYGNDTFGVGLYAYKSDVGFTNYDPVFVRLGGNYNFSDSDSIYAGYAMYDTDTGVADDRSHQISLGYQHNFSPRTWVWAEYMHDNPAFNAKSNNALSLGLRTDF
ncbi:MAG: hypothetical protein CSA47_00785 [Gammaproteobacteria bacterium]|nr:MAG: hypothetical protein CSA47_00785 [Gammaproteobacteria bacterium]